LKSGSVSVFDAPPSKRKRLIPSESGNISLNKSASASCDASTMGVEPSQKANQSWFLQVRRAQLNKNRKLRADVEMKVSKLRDMMKEVEESVHALGEGLNETHKLFREPYLEVLLEAIPSVIEGRKKKSIEYESHKLQ
jgi:hypothetical protein